MQDEKKNLLCFFFAAICWFVDRDRESERERQES